MSIFQKIKKFFFIVKFIIIIYITSALRGIDQIVCDHLFSYTITMYLFTFHVISSALIWMKSVAKKSGFYIWADKTGIRIGILNYR
jgi:hypothetical protein